MLQRFVKEAAVRFLYDRRSQFLGVIANRIDDFVGTTNSDETSAASSIISAG